MLELGCCLDFPTLKLSSSSPHISHCFFGFFSPVVTRCHCRKKSDQKADARQSDINVLDPKEVVAIATGST